MLTIWAKSLDGGRMATTRFIGVAIAAGVLAFAFSQFRYYLYLSRTRSSETRAADANDRERRFYSRQAWRRMQISALAAIAGACMLAGVLLPSSERPRLFVLAWIGVLLFGAWVVALAIADGVATWFFFSEDRRINEANRLALQYKMNKFQEDALRAQREAQEAEDNPKNEQERKVR